jgi:hypothetical protein
MIGTERGCRNVPASDLPPSRLKGGLHPPRGEASEVSLGVHSGPQDSAAMPPAIVEKPQSTYVTSPVIALESSEK